MIQRAISALVLALVLGYSGTMAYLVWLGKVPTPWHPDTCHHN